MMIGARGIVAKPCLKFDKGEAGRFVSHNGETRSHIARLR